MSSDFQKWDIIYISRFPETFVCNNPACKTKYFSLDKIKCPHCNQENLISNVIAKIRPVILWKSQSYWYQSMAFAIPVSSTNPLQETSLEEPIKLEHYIFQHSDLRKQIPMRAVISQATRVDGNVLKLNNKIGILTDKTVQSNIENKLMEWLFNE